MPPRVIVKSVQSLLAVAIIVQSVLFVTLLMSTMQSPHVAQAAAPVYLPIRYQSDEPTAPLNVAAVASRATAMQATSSPIGQVLYWNDFEGIVGSEWSNPTTSVTPSGRKFLGEFGNSSETLSLTSIPTHTSVTVIFELFIIRTWDGNGVNCCGPDIWNLSVAGGPTLLHTTFASYGSAPSGRQAFPGSYPASAYSPGTGSAEHNTLGYMWQGGGPIDSVYYLAYTFPPYPC